ncbi:MAG: WcaI family glycosyltransferase, partial [Alphaproteobacteria bacterium]
MRLLVYGLNMAPEPIGVGKATGELVAFLAGRRHAVRVVTAPPYYPGWRRGEGHDAVAWSREDRDGATVRRAPLYVPQRPTALRRIAHLASFAASSLPVALIEARRHRPSVVLAVAPTLATAPGALAAARVARARSWLHVQDLEIDAAIALGQLRGRAAAAALAAERRLLARFDRVSTIAPAMVERLAAKGVAPDRLRLLPNGVDLAAIRPLAEPSRYRAEWGIDPGATVALYAGNLGRTQGLEVLAGAARR